MPLEILDGVLGMGHPLMENSECAGRELSTRDPVYHLKRNRGLGRLRTPSFSKTATENGDPLTSKLVDYLGAAGGSLRSSFVCFSPPAGLLSAKRAFSIADFNLAYP